MTDTNESWELEDDVRAGGVQGRSFLRVLAVHDVSHMGTNYNMYFSAGASRALGDPEYIQFYMSKNGQKALKVQPCAKRDKSARSVREHKGVSGGASLVKRYGLPEGYYMMRDNNIFMYAGRTADEAMAYGN